MLSYVLQKLLQAVITKEGNNRILGMYTLGMYMHSVILFIFFRIIDDIVDTITYPRNEEQLSLFEQQYHALRDGGTWSNTQYTTLIHAYLIIHRKYRLEDVWIDDFLQSMWMDVRNREYHTIDELYEYMHGSIDFIPRIISRVLAMGDVPTQYLLLFFRGFHVIFLMRDIVSDSQADRIYMPRADFPFHDLSAEQARKNPELFARCIRRYVTTANTLVAQSIEGMFDVKPFYRWCILVHVYLYNMLARMIYKNPYIVYSKQRMKSFRMPYLYYIPYLFYACCISLFKVSLCDIRRRKIRIKIYAD